MNELRFIDRDGKKILQFRERQQVQGAPGDSAYYSWRDVPVMADTDQPKITHTKTLLITKKQLAEAWSQTAMIKMFEDFCKKLGFE